MRLVMFLFKSELFDWCVIWGIYQCPTVYTIKEIKAPQTLWDNFLFRKEMIDMNVNTSNIKPKYMKHRKLIDFDVLILFILIVIQQIISISRDRTIKMWGSFGVSISIVCWLRCWCKGSNQTEILKISKRKKNKRKLIQNSRLEVTKSLFFWTNCVYIRIEETKIRKRVQKSMSFRFQRVNLCETMQKCFELELKRFFACCFV